MKQTSEVLAEVLRVYHFTWKTYIEQRIFHLDFRNDTIVLHVIAFTAQIKFLEFGLCD